MNSLIEDPEIKKFLELRKNKEVMLKEDAKVEEEEELIIDLTEDMYCGSF